TLYTIQNVAVNPAGSTSAPTRDAVRYYTISDLDSTPTVSDGLLYDSSSAAFCFWMPSIMVNGQGHVVWGSSLSAANAYVDALIVSVPSGNVADSTLSFPTAATWPYDPSFDR